ncbi:MAG: hypothetical protein AAF092_15670 [Pseudomonadota bacterium]
MPQPQKRAEDAREDTFLAIARSIGKNIARRNAIIKGEAEGDKDKYSKNISDLLDQFNELSVQSYNELNNSEEVRNTTKRLKSQAKRAKAEARKINEFQDKIDKFTKSLNDITNIVTRLAGLKAL